MAKQRNYDGSGVAREVLISCKMLKRWDLLHETFPHETVRQDVKRKLKLQKVASVFNKSAIPSKVRVNTVPLECQILHKEILEKHADIFKDKIGKTDRVNIPPLNSNWMNLKIFPQPMWASRLMCHIIYEGLQGRNLGKWWMPV